jgi:kynurenine formamidase
MGVVTADRVPLMQFLGPAAVIDAQALSGQGAPGESPAITREFIEDWEHRNGRLQPEDVVLFCTGWTDRFYRVFPEGRAFAFDAVIKKNKPGWPAPDAEAMRHVVGRGVKIAGIDGGAMGGLPDDSPPHYVGLGAGMVFVERLINLTVLPARGAYFIFLPLKCEGGSGAPGRAIAFKPKSGT